MAGQHFATRHNCLWLNHSPNRIMSSAYTESALFSFFFLHSILLTRFSCSCCVCSCAQFFFPSSVCTSVMKSKASNYTLVANDRHFSFRSNVVSTFIILLYICIWFQRFFHIFFFRFFLVFCTSFACCLSQLRIMTMLNSYSFRIYAEQVSFINFLQNSFTWKKEHKSQKLIYAWTKKPERIIIKSTNFCMNKFQNGSIVRWIRKILPKLQFTLIWFKSWIHQKISLIFFFMKLHYIYLVFKSRINSRKKNGRKKSVRK